MYKWYLNLEKLMKLDFKKKRMKTMQKMERWGERGHECSRNKEQVGNGQRLSGMGEDCMGSQGPKWTVVLKKKESSV
jgi:hypothetical protein